MTKKFPYYLMLITTFIFTKSLIAGQYYSTTNPQSFTANELLAKYGTLKHSSLYNTKFIIVVSYNNKKETETLYFMKNPNPNPIESYIFAGNSIDSVRSYCNSINNKN